ncbi:MAG: pyridoxamine 5'-phosphate oxidase family protein [Ferrimicrobium sp.]
MDSTINDEIAEFLHQQPVFFVATAPLLPTGRVNCSPKGVKDTFAIISPTEVAYLDLTGSGSETIAHLRDNGRITLMFCSFDANPRIVRIYGTGRIHPIDTPEFSRYATHFHNHFGARAIISISVASIAKSCGYGVPEMNVVQERSRIHLWLEAKGAEGLVRYRLRNNQTSIDGLPALDA